MIVFDSTQIANLENIFNSDSTCNFLPTTLARNALQSAGLLTYNEPVIFDTPLKSQKDNNHKIKPYYKSEVFLKIHPNPAREFVVIDYKTTDGFLNGNIQFADFHGHVIKSLPISKTIDQIVISLRDIPDGQIIVSLLSDGKKVASQKLLIVR